MERLRDYEDDVLLFTEDLAIPFTNNQAERDIRMSKVQQKISGCLRSSEGAKIFCAIRSDLSTCRKHKVKAKEALPYLLEETWPAFIQKGMAGVPLGNSEEEIAPGLGREAHNWILQEKRSQATFAYFSRRLLREIGNTADNPLNGFAGYYCSFSL